MKRPKIDPSEWEDVTGLLETDVEPTQIVLETTFAIDDYLALEEYALLRKQTVGDIVRTIVLDSVRGRSRAASKT